MTMVKALKGLSWKLTKKGHLAQLSAIIRSKVMKSGVFVSFRGSDTRRTFVSHLLLSLFKKKFRIFKCEEEEEEEIREDKPSTSQVLQAIQESKIAIVVISKNYTASISCLDELAMIIECKEKHSLLVVPVFYQVDPSDVLRQADDFGDGGNNLEMVKRWRDALAKAIQIAFLEFFISHFLCFFLFLNHRKDEEDSYIIDRVMICVSDCFSGPYSLREALAQAQASRVEETLATSAALSKAYSNLKMCRLVILIPIGIVTMGIRLVRAALGTIAGRFTDGGRSSMDAKKDKYVTGNALSPFVLSNDFNSFVGMDRHTEAVIALLDLQLNGTVGGIGICGVGGVGKTTLARCVYEQISPQFQEQRYFTNDAKNYSTCLLEEITRALLMPTSSKSSESESLLEVVKAKLGHRKVLLIVDDLVHIGQLENIWKFFGWFGPGSRLILITEYKFLLVRCKLRRIYEAEPMRYDEALQLFSQFAFKQEQVPRGFYKLSVRAVLVTGRIPLALKVFGSFLCGKCINEWEFELCRLEASQDNSVARVSSYIGDAFS